MQQNKEGMMIRRLEASRRAPIATEPYPLLPHQLPFAFQFVQTKTVAHRSEDDDKDEDDPPKPPQPQATWSNPETTTPDSNDPTNDEEIDWLQDD